MAKVIHIKDTPPKYKENTDYVYIGRPGKGELGYFGNPFSVKDCASRKDCMNKFEEYFYNRIKTDEEYLNKIKALKNKVLVCFCKPNLCHGDVIVEYLNND